MAAAGLARVPEEAVGRLEAGDVGRELGGDGDLRSRTELFHPMKTPICGGKVPLEEGICLDRKKHPRFTQNLRSCSPLKLHIESER